MIFYYFLIVAQLWLSVNPIFCFPSKKQASRLSPIPQRPISLANETEEILEYGFPSIKQVPSIATSSKESSPSCIRKPKPTTLSTFTHPNYVPKKRNSKLSTMTEEEFIDSLYQREISDLTEELKLGFPIPRISDVPTSAPISKPLTEAVEYVIKCEDIELITLLMDFHFNFGILRPLPKQHLFRLIIQLKFPKLHLKSHDAGIILANLAAHIHDANIQHDLIVDVWRQMQLKDDECMFVTEVCMGNGWTPNGDLIIRAWRDRNLVLLRLFLDHGGRFTEFEHSKLFRTLLKRLQVLGSVKAHFERQVLDYVVYRKIPVPGVEADLLRFLMKDNLELADRNAYILQVLLPLMKQENKIFYNLLEEVAIEKRYDLMEAMLKMGWSAKVLPTKLVSQAYKHGSPELRKMLEKEALKPRKSFFNFKNNS